MTPEEQLEQELFDRLTLELNGFNPDLLVPMKDIDDNWLKLKQEKFQPQQPTKTVAKIANCKFRVWTDSNYSRLTAEYDVSYTDGTKTLNRKLNGEFDNTEAHTPAIARALDDVITLIARSDFTAQIRTTRLYEPNAVKQQIREINLIEVFANDPISAWFVYNDHVYPARLDQTQDTHYAWVFNHRKRLTLQQFSDNCWNSI